MGTRSGGGGGRGGGGGGGGGGGRGIGGGGRIPRAFQGGNAKPGRFNPFANGGRGGVVPRPRVVRRP